MIEIVWTHYLQYRAQLRGFDLALLESIIRYSDERYTDTVTGRVIVVGKHKTQLVLIAFEETGENEITPVRVHATTRQQVNYRLKSERFQK
ncbi:MAG: hypothetical protein ACRERU_21350 [Methylococcales bacterium]